MTGSSDLELVELFQKGNETCFNELVRRYQEKIYWVARRFVNDHDQADDIVQEVFIKVYSALKDFRAESGVYTWLYRITVNVALNALRKQRIRDFVRIDEFFDTAGDEHEQPDSIVEKDEQQKLIEEAIAKLPEKQKAVFILRYYEELSYEEISAILKTSIGGLKANYFHAAKKIGEYVHRAS
ncbi:MAG: sigma-70 family RNA polymerase sigma factor [Ignavibacteriae bacterium]|nr:MAG: sigma-70 family RNA polymerase sigma factor [Ignavibacteriota bacterium]